MEQLGYIALGCVLVLAVLVLLRVDWSKIRLPKFGRAGVGVGARTKNSVLLSIAVHAVLALICALFIVTKEIEHDAITVEWVKIPRPMRRVKTLEVKPVQARIIPPRNLATHQATPNTKPVDVKVAAKRSFSLVERNVDLSVDTSEGSVGEIETKADIVAKPREITLSSRSGKAGTGMVTGSADAPGRGKGKTAGKGGLGATIESTGTADSASLEDSDFTHLETVPDGELGAILTGEGKDISGHIRMIRLKHSLSDWWQDPTAMPSFMKWLKDNTRIRADMKYKGGSLLLTEPDIQDAPLIFMTGHDKDITVGRGLAKDGPLLDGFSTEERAALRRYIVERGGMLFFRRLRVQRTLCPTGRPRARQSLSGVSAQGYSAQPRDLQTLFPATLASQRGRRVLGCSGRRPARGRRLPTNFVEVRVPERNHDWKQIIRRL